MKSNIVKYLTKLPKDLAFGSSITGSPPAESAKNPTNLAKGAFVGRGNACCLYLDVDPLWLLVDFGEPRSFDTISIEILTHHTYVIETQPGDIWYSNSSTTTDGDFTNFKKFGSFPLLSTSGQIEIIKRDEKVTARYVGFLANSGVSFHFCHLQIY